jgi:predicted ATPase/class 3 adenylate cyclase
MQPPSGNVTFLFTDIERSSQLWEMHPQAMGRALAQHDGLLRGIFMEYRGLVFKTIGDAFCVAFQEPLDGLHAALAAQRALAAAAWEETGPLRVRMALHTGEAEQRDNDYFGQTLNRVARILATGHGGQILLSHVVAEGVGSLLSPELALRDFGERRLKDLNQPERIFQVVAPDLDSDFPPLRSMEYLPNNLPAQVTSFIGRSREIAEAKRMLDTTRLLTLIGPGGTGKTRLSLHVAAEMLEGFSHGVWLVELATLSDPALLPKAIADAADLREEAGRSALDTLLDAWRSRKLLLVLDNCEHLVAACAQIAATLMRRCPDIKILASSREPLNIEGETLWPVPSLAVPRWDYRTGNPHFENLEELESVQLFVERAAAVKPGFKLGAGNGDWIGKIVWRLDGIPLAIELAAARVKMLTLPQIYDRLDNRFQLLSGGSRAALPRQQTLGALIDWSYDLLTEPERILLRRLSVFVAGRTLEMAEEVCAGDGLDRAEIFDLLYSLADKSLLMIETGEDGETRFTMLESIWDYADNKLIEHNEQETCRRRHLDYFMRLAEQAEPELKGPNAKDWLEKLNTEHHNLNAALRFSAGQEDTLEAGLRLAGASARYWEVRSFLAEGYTHCTTLLAKAGSSIAPAVRAKAELGAGAISWCQDRDEQALPHLQAAHRYYQQSGPRFMEGFLEGYLGLIERNEGRNANSRAHFENVRRIAEETGSPVLRAFSINGLGGLAAVEGDFAQARSLKEEAARIIKSTGDLWIYSLIIGSLGEVCFTARDLASARSHVLEALSITLDLGNKWAIPYGLELLADIDAEEGKGGKAVRLYGAAASLRELLNLSSSPTETQSYRQSLSRLHQLVPPKEFDDEWQQGRALRADAAVELALA